MVLSLCLMFAIVDKMALELEQAGTNTNLWPERSRRFICGCGELHLRVFKEVLVITISFIKSLPVPCSLQNPALESVD